MTDLPHEERSAGEPDRIPPFVRRAERAERRRVADRQVAATLYAGKMIGSGLIILAGAILYGFGVLSHEGGTFGILVMCGGGLLYLLDQFAGP